MEYQKIVNVLDDTTNQPSKFGTRNWVKMLMMNHEDHIMMRIIIVIMIIILLNLKCQW